MKWCLPSSGIAPFSGSGGERYSADLALGLRRAGQEPHVLLAARKPFHPDLLGSVESVYPRKGLRWPVMPFAMAPAILRCWRRHRFDLLVSHSVRYTGPACLIGRAMTGRPVVLHAHHLEPDRLTQFLDTRCFRAADCVVADSEFVCSQLLAAGVSPARIALVHCGAPDWALALGSYREDRKHTGGVPTVLVVGPLIMRKNSAMILRAFAALPQSLRDRSQLVFVGDGPQRASLRTAAAQLGVSVQVLGFVSEADKRRWYERADVFLHAASLEGFPLAVLEAMAAGLPVVALKAASLGELVMNRVTGHLVANHREMAWRLARLLESASERAGMGRAGHERVSDFFSATRTVERVGALYEQVAAR